MIMDITSKMGDDTYTPSFWPFHLGNDQPPPPPPSTSPPVRHCSSLIFFWKHIKFVMNIV